jgi:HTH-type transcriptional regulator/antitoxin HipB
MKASRKPKDLIIATRAADQLAQAIARYRARSGLTQASLAKSAGLRQATISKIEKGLGTTKIETIYAICAALGLEVVLRPRRSSSEVDFSYEESF